MTNEQEPLDEDLIAIEVLKDTIRERAPLVYTEPDITAWARLEAFLRRLLGED